MTDQRKYTSKLVDKHVLIIGGSSGIGYGVAEASLEHGARVTISSSNPSRLASAVQRLSAAYPSAAAGGRIESAVCDLGDGATLEANVAALFAGLSSRLDHVVFSAGDALATMPLADATVERMTKAGTVRFYAPLICAREAAKRLPRSADASFAITSGAVAERPMPGWAVVGSFAAGHFSMTRALALEMKPVRVNCVAPGAVDTGLWRMPAEEKEMMMKGLEQKMPTGRVGRVEDVAESFLYLMKDGNVTGSVISTNGGALLV
ncbi:putative short chain dehydrogenase reductase family protein [Neofusicoccum parvum UCRNP2]|uniref:Putative short chain dehydrogenase reductase family protein n=1 Tax=Botryosphaeria parva (strain UCR-NP2) TaxID=1287680 RepID=R1GXK2_BOTPV|nr:putative short chain dehydrogenase reductase family protein [Neofusicoccum parvum UCRNP2]